MFLQTASFNDAATGAFAGGMTGSLLALGAAMFLFVFLFMIAYYIVNSWAFMSLGKKVKYSTPGLAWIPVVGPALISSKTAKMHWWPILLLIGFWIPFVGNLLVLAFTVFSIIWLYHTYEKINRPGWWAILMILPVVGLVMLCIAAWGK
jgi:hypothetical protein